MSNSPTGSWYRDSLSRYQVDTNHNQQVCKHQDWNKVSYACPMHMSPCVSAGVGPWPLCLYMYVCWYVVPQLYSFTVQSQGPRSIDVHHMATQQVAAIWWEICGTPCRVLVASPYRSVLYVYKACFRVYPKPFLYPRSWWPVSPNLKCQTLPFPLQQMTSLRSYATCCLPP